MTSRGYPRARDRLGARLEVWLYRYGQYDVGHWWPTLHILRDMEMSGWGFLTCLLLY